MMDGRFDQKFAELFAASRTHEDRKGALALDWPLALACICSLVVFVLSAILACRAIPPSCRISMKAPLLQAVPERLRQPIRA